MRKIDEHMGRDGEQPPADDLIAARNASTRIDNALGNWMSGACSDAEFMRTVRCAMPKIDRVLFDKDSGIK